MFRCITDLLNRMTPGEVKAVGGVTAVTASLATLLIVESFEKGGFATEEGYLLAVGGGLCLLVAAVHAPIFLYGVRESISNGVDAVCNAGVALCNACPNPFTRQAVDHNPTGNLEAGLLNAGPQS